MTKTEEIKKYIKVNDIEAEIIEHYDQPALTCEIAAKVHEVDIGSIVKTLFIVDKKDIKNAAVIVMQGDKKLDVKKIPNIRAPRFATNDEVKKWLNAEIGGVPPLAVPPEIPIYIDSSVFDKAIVYGSAGHAGNALRIKPQELLKQPNTTVRDLSRAI